MALQQGVRLGSFEVLGPLGAGGMGEVYRARDTRLGRDVAIKVLPEAFARDPARAARFEREARLLAAINHPAIAAIYGAEEFDSLRCIILELVPGETLAERLARSPLALEESLALSGQIAEALEAAHERGVVHRDLKPSNIKITPEGKVKVLDFGLAKAMEVPSAEDISKSPTLVAEQTRPGVILGTVEFMSPEQARGKAVDKRTDIWAFGCILFEMLSGRRAFTGETPSDVLVMILTSEPDWRALPAETPASLRELLGRCLEKDPNRRLRDIGEARIAIEKSLGDLRGFAPPARASRARPLRAAAWLLSTAAVLAAAWLVLRPRAPSPASVPGTISLAVLPFKNLSSEAGDQLLGDGLAETVSVRLAKLPGIQVVTSLAVHDAAQNEPDPYRAASRLGANVVISGSLQRSNQQVRIIYAVLNATDRKQLAGDQVTGSASDLFAIQDQVADQVADGLKLKIRAGEPSAPGGLTTASEQERYVQALGLLQRYDRPASVDEAIRLLEGLAAERPGSALPHASLARAYLVKFNLTRDRSWADRAATSSARARQSKPGLPEVDITAGEVALRTGKPAEAVAAFQRALASQPNSYEALLGLAGAQNAAGDPDRAERSYKRAIALQPSYFACYSKLGGFYFSRGRYAEGAEMFRRVTELTPDNARAFSNMAACYHQMDRFEEALAACRRSLAIEPTSGAYSNAGSSEFFLGRYGEASKDFEKAVALTPDRYDGWADLADAYYWSGRRSEAHEAYQKAIRMARSELQVNPRDPSAHARLAVCLARTGEISGARGEIARAVELAARDPRVLYDAAIVSKMSGHKDEALVWLGRAVAAGSGVLQIRREPEFAGLQKEPRFEEELRKALRK